MDISTSHDIKSMPNVFGGVSNILSGALPQLSPVYSWNKEKSISSL